MRHGYVAGDGQTKIRPIDIRYEPSREDDIVEVVDRLDQLGDLIDGEIDDREARDLLKIVAS